MLYRTAPGEGPLTNISHLAKPIAIDPLTDLTNMVEARRLSQALLAIYPDTDTTVEKAAFTFLAIAAFGMILRDSPHKGSATFDSAVAWAEEGLGEDASGYRREFLELIKQARAATPAPAAAR